jgi:hypothetical protein
MQGNRAAAGQAGAWAVKLWRGRLARLGQALLAKVHKKCTNTLSFKNNSVSVHTMQTVHTQCTLGTISHLFLQVFSFCHEHTVHKAIALTNCAHSGRIAFLKVFFLFSAQQQQASRSLHGLCLLGWTVSSSSRPGRSTIKVGAVATVTLIYLWTMSGTAVSESLFFSR